MRSRYLGAIVLSALIAFAGVTPARPDDADRQGKGHPRHNVIVVVADGLRADAVNPTDAPTMWRLRNSGVSFANSHSVFPTFTTPNAAAIATGHFPGDTGDFSNALFTGFPVFNGRPPSFTGKTPGTNVPFIEDDQVLGDIDEHFPGGNFLSEEALLAFGRRHGFHTAAVGKLGPTLIQDVTQGNPLNGAFTTPDTVVIDDRTGTTTGLPLSAAIQTALQNSGLPLATPPRVQPAGNNVTPGTRDANIAQQQYFADAITKAVLPTFRVDGEPFILVYWSRDPDGSQHNQGDSLNTLVPGINGPTSKAAIKNADDNLRQILDFIRSDPDLAAKSDVFVTADHGFSTISRHDLDASGRRFTKSYAATRTYRDPSGRLEVNAGFLPPGFVAIDLAHGLGLPLFDADSQITVGGINVYTPVDPTVPQPTATVRQRPASGNGLIGGSGRIGDPTDAKVVVAANGGSNLIYVPDHDQALVRRIVGVLAQQDYTGGIFVDDAYGRVPGALPLSAINLKGSAALPTPAVVLNFRSFPTDPANRLLTMVEIADTGLQQGQGMHGSFSRADTFNFMAATGPDFKRGFVDHAPVSNADIAVTFADILGFDLPGKGKLSGRVLEEALARGHSTPSAAHHVRVSPRIPGSKFRTVLLFQTLGQHVYADEACFTALPVAHDGQDDDHVQALSAAQHANLCAAALLP
ncbi:MAG TPA: alkaline phosphatase family protein [Methylomirabilota bacterium]|nr:alkaline phosphatase family protein [Methylomirabilota bacterium]